MGQIRTSSPASPGRSAGKTAPSWWPMGRPENLRVFDSTGRFHSGQGATMVRAARRVQAGIERIARCGPNELWIDARSRISVWNMQLEYLREFPVTDNIMWPLVCFGGRGLLVKRDIGNEVAHPPNTIYIDSLKLMALRRMGASRRDLMPIPLWSYIDVPSKRIGFPHPFGRSTLLAGDGPNLVVGFAERLEVKTYSSSGRLLRIARGPTENLALSVVVRRDYQSVELAGQEKVFREGLEAAGNPIPKTIPAYTDLRVDTEGNVWLKRFEPPGHLGNRWGVFPRQWQVPGASVAAAGAGGLLRSGPTTC